MADHDLLSTKPDSTRPSSILDSANPPLQRGGTVNQQSIHQSFHAGGANNGLASRSREIRNRTLRGRVPTAIMVAYRAYGWRCCHVQWIAASGQ